MGSDAAKKESDTTPAPYYSCNMDRPFFLDKRVSTWFHLGMSHTFGIAGFYLLAVGAIPRAAIWLVLLHGYIGDFGITIGAHRLWSHHTFKARLPLQIFLAYCQTAAGQLSIFQWCRDHRLHHKYADTYADPYSTRRGLFFSHMGWLLRKEHPLCKEMEKNIPLHDLNDDWVIWIQSKFYWPLFAISGFVVPIWTFTYFFPELTWFQLFALNYAQLLIPMHLIFCVNSIAHRYGFRPWDKYINPVDVPILSYFIIGEGWHNYHHTFPWDYKSHEAGLPGFGINWGRLIIEFFAWTGQAYDLKTVPMELALKRMNRTGYPKLEDNHFHSAPKKIPLKNEKGEEIEEDDDHKETPVWGWGDETMHKEDLDITETSYVRSSSG